MNTKSILEHAKNKLAELRSKWPHLENNVGKTMDELAIHGSFAHWKSVIKRMENKMQL